MQLVTNLSEKSMLSGNSGQAVAKLPLGVCSYSLSVSNTGCDSKSRTPGTFRFNLAPGRVLEIRNAAAFRGYTSASSLIHLISFRIQ